MPRITVDGRTIDFREQQTILQACLEAGIEIPHYCYHPGLSIVASCRICLVEVEGVPKLLPSCQTLARDGMVVYTRSPAVVANQKAVMEYLLISHPLDCPVCDQAGECLLQDYSYRYGRAEARFAEEKHKRPKKDLGPHVLLYNDRCIMCSRCVRFTREVSGTCELYVDGRGHRAEIDIFPGKPLDNPLSGNVVDLCPVGALLDKDFLFRQRVWLLSRTPSISPADSGGENIYIEHNEGVVYRIKPRYNPLVNRWWISDDTRYSYKALYDPRRLKTARRMQYNAQVETTIERAMADADRLLRQTAAGAAGVLFAVLSPMLACEEAWLLGRYIRTIDPGAVLVAGPAPTTGQDTVLRHYLTGRETFRIRAEKVPNAAGIRRVMEMLGGPTAAWEALVRSDTPELKALRGGWIVGGYHGGWPAADQPPQFRKGLRIVQDILPGPLADAAEVFIPGALWAEKDGCWENCQGLVQVFAAAVPAPAGVVAEGEVYARLLRRAGGYQAAALRREMGGVFATAMEPAEQGPATRGLEFVEI